MKIIDAEGKTLGRMCSKVVKDTMRGENIKIINCEKAIIKGSKKNILEKYRTKFNLKDKGNPTKSPKTISRRPDIFVRKTIKRMMPEGKEKGKKAQKRIKTYINDPENQAKNTGKEKNNKIPNTPHITVKELCEKLGWSDQK